MEAFVDEVANLVRSQSASIFGNVFVVFPVAYVLGLAPRGRVRDPDRRGQGGEDGRFALDPRAVGALRRVHGRAAVVFERAGGLGGQLVPLPPARARPSPAHRRLAYAFGPSAMQRVARLPRPRDRRPHRQRVARASCSGRVPVVLRLLRAAGGGAPRDAFDRASSRPRWWRWGSGSRDERAFWLAVAGIALIGALNVGVSFALALHVAIRARDIGGVRRRAVYGAILRRMAREPASFLLPRARRPEIGEEWCQVTFLVSEYRKVT